MNDISHATELNKIGRFVFLGSKISVLSRLPSLDEAYVMILGLKCLFGYSLNLAVNGQCGNKK